VKPHELKPPKGARKPARRVGRGEGSGRGKTAGRGTKGTRARGSVHLFFEGGQMPLTRRVPKLKGFKPPRPTVYGAVNVGQIEGLDSAAVGPDELRSAGLLHKRDKLVKILGSGEIGRAVTVRAHAFSESARTKIEGAGGKAEIIETKPKPKPKNKNKKARP
jgi:large subunit ribosomal protein L15